MGRSHRSKSLSNAGLNSSSNFNCSRRCEHSNRQKHSKRLTNSNSTNFNTKSSLRNLSQNVNNMVNIARKQTCINQTSNDNNNNNNSHSCTCPYDCGLEIMKLKQDVLQLKTGLDFKDSKNRTIYKIDYFIQNRLQLLSEAWISIGKSKLGNLVPPSLMTICARREKRDARHSGIKSTNVSTHIHPFTSFDRENFQLGISELWRRCVQELEELSDAQIKEILDGSLVYVSEESGRKLTNSNFILPDINNNAKYLSHIESSLEKKTYAADSTTNHVMLETDERRREMPNLGTSYNNYMTNSTNIQHQPQKNESISIGLNKTKTLPESDFDNNEIVMPVKKSEDSKNIVDLVNQEINELEMRARAIRSMLKMSSTVQTT